MVPQANFLYPFASSQYPIAVSTLADIISQYSTRWSDLDLYMLDYCYQYFRAITLELLHGKLDMPLLARLQVFGKDETPFRASDPD